MGNKLNLYFFKIFVFGFVLSLVTSIGFAYSEETGTLLININSTNSEGIYEDSTNLLIYQGLEKTPFMEKSLDNNPETIILPKNHKYKIEVYVNGMYTDVEYVNLKEPKKLDFAVPQPGGIKFNVFYEDGEIPIKNATVIIKSNDGKQQASGQTDENGYTKSYWLQSTNRAQDYYVAEIYFDEIFLTSVSNIKIDKGVSHDQKIVVPIPAVVDELITFRLYDADSNQILETDGNYSVLLVGKNGSPLESQITENKGNIYFLGTPSDVYSAFVLKDGIKDPLWNETRIVITGSQNNFSLIQRDLIFPISDQMTESGSPFSEKTEKLQIEIKSINGDRIRDSSTNLLIYQGLEKTPFMEKSLDNNPETIILPKNHKYKIEVYVNGMYTDVEYVNLNQVKKLDFAVPQSGGIKFNVFYEDGEIPIKNATVIIKSNDGKQRASGQTDENGYTKSYWLQSTNRAQDYYVAEIYFDEIFLTSVSNIKIDKGVSHDQKIVVPIPAVVDELITFRLYDAELNKFLNQFSSFSVLLTDQNNNLYQKSFISKNGDIFFSNIPAGMYTVSVLKNGVKDSSWVDFKVAIIGIQDNFDLIQKD